MRVRPFHFYHWLTSALCVLASTALPISAAEQLTLKETPGSTTRLQREQKTEQTLTVAGMPVKTSSSMFFISTIQNGDSQPDGSIVATEKVTVLQAELDVAGNKLQFDSANPDAPVNGPLEPMAKLFRTIYQTPVETVYDKSGKIQEFKIPTEARVGLDPTLSDLFDPEKLKQRSQQHRNLLPDMPVETGAKWTRNEEIALGAGQVIAFRTEYEYTGLVDQPGGKRHRIVGKPLSVNYSIDPNSPSPLKLKESKLDIKEGGDEYLLDPAVGQFVLTSGRAQITGTLTLVAGAMELPCTLDLTISSKSERQPQ